MAKYGKTTLSDTTRTTLFEAAADNAAVKPTTAKVKNAAASAGDLTVFINGEATDILEAGDTGFYRPAGGVQTIEVQAASTAVAIHAANVVLL